MKKILIKIRLKQPRNGRNPLPAGTALYAIGWNHQLNWPHWGHEATARPAPLDKCQGDIVTLGMKHHVGWKTVVEELPQ